VRIGINSGPGVVGNVGDGEARGLHVLGSSVNIASRLESGVAKPGQLVISQNTLNLVVGSFETEPPGEFALKARVQKMPVFSVKSSPQAKRARAPDVRGRTIGRIGRIGRIGSHR
jgi:adenylate cyclase